MYIRYIHKLYDLHLKAQNFTGNSAWSSDREWGWGGWGCELATDAFNMITPLLFIIRDEDLGTSLLKSKCILIICMFFSTVFLTLSLHDLSEVALRIMK